MVKLFRRIRVSSRLLNASNKIRIKIKISKQIQGWSLEGKTQTQIQALLYNSNVSTIKWLVHAKTDHIHSNWEVKLHRNWNRFSRWIGDHTIHRSEFKYLVSGFFFLLWIQWKSLMIYFWNDLIGVWVSLMDLPLALWPFLCLHSRIWCWSKMFALSCFAMNSVRIHQCTWWTKSFNWFFCCFFLFFFFKTSGSFHAHISITLSLWMFFVYSHFALFKPFIFFFFV